MSRRFQEHFQRLKTLSKPTQQRLVLASTTLSSPMVRASRSRRGGRYAAASGTVNPCVHFGAHHGVPA